MNIVKQGHSFSGHERHCCFLNTGQTRFADISGISGLDLPDDGRGVAITDWDLDGDLDFWVSNRNGPQIRFLQNNYEGDSRALTLRLEGRSVNRDAIGTRVELHLRDGRPAQLRTLRAGAGFLSQSSKTIHFGLAAVDQIDRLVVRWPDGSAAEHTDVKPGSRYLLVQGEKPRLMPGRGDLKLPESLVSIPPGTSSLQLRSFSLLPLPPSSYLTFAGKRASLRSEQAPLTLVVLWSQTCPPCLEELAEISRRANQLRQAGFDVVALAVDALDETAQVDRQHARRSARAVLQRMQFPFASGLANAGLVDRLQIINNTLFDLHEPLSVPLSVMLDSRRRVACLYKGPVSVDRLLKDRQQLVSSAEQWRLASVPFAGRWIGSKKKRSLLPIVSELFQQGDLDAAVWYFDSEFANLLTKDPAWPGLAVRMADECTKQGDESTARRLRDAIETM